jgi:hypothetical protein
VASDWTDFLQTQRAAMPDLCRVHSHVLPAPDPKRLARAVESALDEVLGHERAGQVYTVVTDHDAEHRVPLAQRALMWVGENMPASAERVLDRARSHYADAPLTPAT